MHTASMLIGGALRSAGADGSQLDSINPASGLRWARVPDATAADVDEAVSAALRASTAWLDIGPAARFDLLRLFGNRLVDEAETIALLEVADSGNTIGKVRDDIRAAVQYIEFVIGLAARIEATGHAETTTDRISVETRSPYPVVARIIPFNHPVLFAVKAIASALSAGACVVVKAPEEASVSIGAVAVICERLFPPGVVNIIMGLGRQAGDLLVRHPGIKRIAFTGSVPTGRVIQAHAAEAGVKHVTLELGGKNAMIVAPDADLDRVAAAIPRAMALSWAGQSCGSMSRLLVHQSIADQLTERVVEVVRSVHVGAPSDEETDMGPMISARQRDRALGLAQAAAASGARLLAGGRTADVDSLPLGHWIEPTVVDGVTPDMDLWRQEVFGPVLSIARWDKEEEMLALANDTEYGLTASIWTANTPAALRWAAQLDVGYVWSNHTGTHYVGFPFSGHKNSGIGSEESLEELLSMYQSKSIHVMF